MNRVWFSAPRDADVHQVFEGRDIDLEELSRFVLVHRRPLRRRARGYSPRPRSVQVAGSARKPSCAWIQRERA